MTCACDCGCRVKITPAVEAHRLSDVFFIFLLKKSQGFFLFTIQNPKYHQTRLPTFRGNAYAPRIGGLWVKLGEPLRYRATRYWLSPQLFISKFPSPSISPKKQLKNLLKDSKDIIFVFNLQRKPPSASSPKASSGSPRLSGVELELLGHRREVLAAKAAAVA